MCCNRAVEPGNPRLYAIVCADACEQRGLELLSVGAALSELRPWAVQLRAKNRPASEVLVWLKDLRKLTAQQGVRLFCNDRADLAALAGADGVHVGQDDLPVSEVRKHFPGLLVGLSTHNAAQMVAALDQNPDYVALGPVFATTSKADHDAPLGLAGLSEVGALARARGIPLVAIGGLGRSSASVVASQCEHIALISSLLPDVEEMLSTSPLNAVVRRRVEALFGSALG